MQNNENLDKGSRIIQGILTEVIFETPYECEEKDINENTKIDFITLIIDERPVLIYPFRDLLIIKDIPPMLTFFNDKSFEEMQEEQIIIKMMVRKYGTHLFAFDYDLFNALIGRKKR
jgi:hypothetical protein